MDALNLPPYPFKVKQLGEHRQLFDEIRRKWVVLTPEEWVRQHLAMYLVSLGYPRGLIALERSLKVNGMSRRSDLLVFTTSGQAFLLAECKAPGVPISQETLDQAARYNLTLRVPYILISNGIKHYCLHTDKDGKSSSLEGIPEFPSIE